MKTNLITVYQNFPDVSAYCQKLRDLKDQPLNVDRPVSGRALVLHLCVGIIDSDYDLVAQSITQTKPILSFDEARSRILLEESLRQNKEHTGQVLLTQNSTTTTTVAAPPQQPPHHQGRGSGTRRGNRGRGGKGGRSRGRGRGMQHP